MQHAEERIWSFFRRAPVVVKAKLLSLWIMAALVVGFTGYVLFTIFTFVDHGPVAHKKIPMPGDPQAPVAEFTYPYSLNPVAIALVDKRRVRTGYAQFALVFDCPNEKSVRTMELNRAKILNALNETAIQFTFEDFQGPSGFARFKTTYLNALKTLFGKDAPRTIALRDWLMN